MQTFEILVALLLAGTVLAAAARHFGAPYPALVALGGAAIALFPGAPSSCGRPIMLAAMEARRRRLLALRADGTIGDAAFQLVEEEIDWAELHSSHLFRTGQQRKGKI